MSEAAQKALDTLVEITDNKNADPDVRIRAACAILLNRTDEAERKDK